jgi:pimeloyl-ACP methyl ester carboxylesterase
MSEGHVNGVRLYYEVHGEGPAILCIHGAGSSALMWGAAVPELARLGRVIVYDRRGCTRSQRPDAYDKTSVAEHADDAAALLDTLGAAPAAVIGRSYGGQIATDLALRYPERVRGLVLLEGASLGLSAEAAAWEESLRQRVMAAAADDLATVGERFIRTVLGDAAWDGFPAPIRQMFTDNSPAILAEVNAALCRSTRRRWPASTSRRCWLRPAHSRRPSGRSPTRWPRRSPIAASTRSRVGI